MAPITYHELAPPASDGVTDHYPTNTTPPSGLGDYYRPVSKGENKDILYRTKLAQWVAEELSPTHPDKHRLIWSELPSGYQLFEHVKNRGDGLRKDTYLFGHPTGKRFRSPAEFKQHALFLTVTDPAAAALPADATAKWKQCGCPCCAGGRGPNPTPSATPRKTAELLLAARRTAYLEERLGEQELSGWIFRKGEIVWVWTGTADELATSANDPKTPLWAAGVVVEKPTVNTSLAPPAANTSFAALDMDDSAPWEDAKQKTYTIQLCAPGPAPGALLRDTPQWFVRPWLSRPAHTADSAPERHPSIPPARQAAMSFSLYEKTARRPDGNQEFACLFLGAEKIFVGEPVRIANPSTHENLEDVLVLSAIYARSEGGADEARKSIIMFEGSVYTTQPGQGDPLSPEQFAGLPFRMRRGDGSGSTIRWWVRNAVDEVGVLSLRHILGRWYEPVAVERWMQGYPGTQKLGQKKVKVWVKNRKEAMGWAQVGDVALENEEDKRSAPTATLVGSAKGKGRGEETPVVSGFRAINEGARTASVSSRVSKRAAEDDDGEDGELGVLTKSPTKRLTFRS